MSCADVCCGHQGFAEIVCVAGCGAIYCSEVHREHDLKYHDHASRCCPPKPHCSTSGCPHTHDHHLLICKNHHHHHVHACYNHSSCGRSSKVVVLEESKSPLPTQSKSLLFTPPSRAAAAAAAK